MSARSIAAGGSASTLSNANRDGSKGGSGRKRGLCAKEKIARMSSALHEIQSTPGDDAKAKATVKHARELGQLPPLKTLKAEASSPTEKKSVCSLLMLLGDVCTLQPTMTVDLEDGTQLSTYILRVRESVLALTPDPQCLAGGGISGPSRRTRPRRGTWDFGAGVGRLGVSGELLTKIIDEQDLAGFIDGGQSHWEEVESTAEEMSAEVLHQFGREAAHAAMYTAGTVLVDVGRALWAAFGRTTGTRTKNSNYPPSASHYT